MKKQDAEERVYYDDLETKVTASFVAGHKKIILPVERIDDVIVTHKAYSMYLCFTLCLCVILIFCLAPFLPAVCGISIRMSRLAAASISCRERLIESILDLAKISDDSSAESDPQRRSRIKRTSSRLIIATPLEQLPGHCFRFPAHRIFRSPRMKV